MRRHQSASQPVELARQALGAALEAAQNIDVNDVRDSLTTQAARAAEAAQNVDLNAVRDTVASEVSKDVDLVIVGTRQRPIRSLIIAVGVGAAIGALVDRMSRKREAEKAKAAAWGPS
jgi:hypothetical protein